MNPISRFFSWIRRYISITLLIVVAFIIVTLFFNEHSMMKAYEYDIRNNQKKEELRRLNDSLVYYHNLNQLLNADPQTMERVVRERHHMRRPNEDVYIFQE